MKPIVLNKFYYLDEMFYTHTLKILIAWNLLKKVVVVSGGDVGVVVCVHQPRYGAVRFHHIRSSLVGYRTGNDQLSPGRGVQSR